MRRFDSYLDFSILSLPGFLLGAALLVPLGGIAGDAGTAWAQAAPEFEPPEVDGDLEDLIQFAQETADSGFSCGLVTTDPAADVVTTSPSVVPCTPFVPGGSAYFQNGFDQVLSVVALDWGSLNADLYLGLRVAGTIGDPDGNDNPDSSCSAGNIPDAAGISPRDVYRWEFDTVCGGEFAADVWVEVTGDPQNPGQAIVRTQGLTVQSTAVAWNGSELEVVLRHTWVDSWFMLLEPRFLVRATADNLDDTIAPDFTELEFCTEPTLSLTVDTYFDVERVCPGDTVIVSASVFNWSLVTLEEVTLDDYLPPGWTYVPGSAVRIGEPTVVGNQLTFPTFPLWPVEGIWIHFLAVVPLDAEGDQVNRAVSTGTQISTCVPGGRRSIGPIEDTASVLARGPQLRVNVTSSDACRTGSMGFSFEVINTASRPQLVELLCLLDGSAVIPSESVDLGSGERVTRTLAFPCTGPATRTLTCTARAASVDTPFCDVEVVNTLSGRCVEPCVTLRALTTTVCAAANGTARFELRSCSTAPQDVSINGTLDGVALSPINYADLPAGAVREFAVPVSCNGEPLAFRWAVDASLAGFLDCGSSSDYSFDIPCGAADVAITRSREEGPDGAARVTLRVTNTGGSRLDPLQVTEFLRPELEFPSQDPTGSCSVDVSAVEPTVGGATLIRFTDFALDGGASCTIVYDVRCAETGMGDSATASVSAWCAGTFGTGDPVTDEASDFVSCNGLTCPAPQPICFWRVQAGVDPGDDDGDSDDDQSGDDKHLATSSTLMYHDEDDDVMCREAFVALSRCVIDHFQATRFAIQVGQWVTAAELAALGDEDLADALADQLDLDNYDQTRDYAEGQYLTLLYNVCAGLVSPSTELQDGGTVGDVLDELANALNTQTAEDTWRRHACAINNRHHLVLPEGCDPEECDDHSGDDHSGEDDHSDDDDDDDDDHHNGNAGLTNTADDDLRCCGPLFFGGTSDHDECCAGSSCGGKALGIRLGFCPDDGQGPLAQKENPVILAFPNPASGSETRLVFRVPEALSGERCLVEIYDVSGRRVRCLVEEAQPGGLHEVYWDLRSERGGRVVNGIYFASVRVGPLVHSNRILVLSP